MMLTLSNRQRRVRIDKTWVEESFERLSAAVLSNLRRRRPAHLKDVDLAQLGERGQLSVVLTSNENIRKINKEWMGKDYATDVLSFPLDLVPPPVGLPWEFGEIVISLEKAEEQAAAYGHSFERELAFLFVHGLLHVLGFDHASAAEEKEMFGRQKEILDKAGFKR
ncbi:MAG: rRNA maturation RNase YbeY [Candidatus Obscuribacterales bacterium]